MKHSFKTTGMHTMFTTHTWNYKFWSIVFHYLDCLDSCHFHFVGYFFLYHFWIKSNLKCPFLKSALNCYYFVKVFKRNHLLKSVSLMKIKIVYDFAKKALLGVYLSGLIWNWSGARAGTKEISSFLFWHWDETGFNQTLLLSPTGNYPLLKASIG